MLNRPIQTRLHRWTRPRGALPRAAGLLLLSASACAAPEADESNAQIEQALTGTITVNAATRYQTMQGFGVNAQPENWGARGAAFAGTADAMVNDLGFNIFRVEIQDGSSNWETTNDDANPNNYNWTYYDNLYATDPRMQRFVAYVRHLNEDLGISTVEIAAHGLVPPWMGSARAGLQGSCVTSETGCGALPANSADEWAEEIVSFVEWAHNRLSPPLKFAYVAPFNETDLCSTEGICLQSDASRTALLAKIVTRMNAFPDLAAIKLVAAEASGPGSDGRSAIMANPTVAPRMAAFAYHQYNASSTQDAYNTSSPPEFLTEYNGFSNPFCGNPTWAGGGTNHADLLLNGLLAGNSAALVWDDVDAWHVHQDNFQTFGLFFTGFASASPPVADGARCAMSFPTLTQLDGATYAPRSQYHVTKHFSKFVAPGARRVAVTLTGNGTATAFLNPDSSIVIAGRNKSTTAGESVHISLGGGTSTNLASVRLYYSNASSNFVLDPTVYPLTNSVGTLTSGAIVIPPDSVFSLVTSAGAPAVTLTAPSADPTIVTLPSSVTLTATATPVGAATVTDVTFYADGVAIPGCSKNASPYTCTYSPTASSFFVTAKATDSAGLVATTPARHLEVQSTAPTTTIISPAAGTLATSTIAFTSTATAASGLAVRSVSYFDGAAFACIAYVPGPGNTWPCNYILPSTGSHTLTARSLDTSGNLGPASSSVSVTFNQTLLLGDSAVETTDDLSDAGRIDAYQYTTTTAGTVNKLCAFVPSTSAATTLQLGVYSEAASRPGTLLGSATASTLTKNAWNCATLASGVAVTATTNYWLAVVSPNVASSTLVVNAGAGLNCWSTGLVSALPAGAFATQCGTGKASLYGMSVVGGASPPTVTTPTVTPTGAHVAGSVLTFASTPTAGSLPLTKVQYLSGATVLCTATASPWSCAWTSTSGSFNVNAVVSDNAAPANTGASPGALALTVSPPSSAPAAVTNLAASGATSSSVALSWTVPTGSPTSYSIRYATAAITSANFTSATLASGIPVPGASGTGQNMTVTGLAASTAYFFALESSNASGTSAISGMPSLTTTAAASGLLFGLNSTSGTAADTSDAGTIDSYQFTASASGTADVLQVFLGAASVATTLQIGLYSDSAGKPGALLGFATLTGAQASAWNAVTLPTGVAITSGTKYWIAVLSPTSGSVTLMMTSSIGVNTNCWSGTVATLPASFGAPLGCGNGEAAAYATP